MGGRKESRGGYVKEVSYVQKGDKRMVMDERSVCVQ